MEKHTIERDSRVCENFQLPVWHPSNAEHEEFCMNLPGPSGKAKYSEVTDSEPVPWGKGEKNPSEGSEIVPETVCLQAVGGAQALTMCLLHNEPASKCHRQG